jgi:hypothetical protein
MLFALPLCQKFKNQYEKLHCMVYTVRFIELLTRKYQ